MDRRSWPWRKKSSEKIVIASNESAESSPVHSTRHPDDQDVSKILADHTRTSNEGTIQWQQSEESIKHLNERLSASLLDVAAKDILVKQHAKVAEEAVSGWEKAEAEAATLKQQLDSALQQKLATEDRVSHLDGALKECMRQLRHVREEQEEKIHEAIVKKTRDWDRARSELEEKLADVEQKFLERDAENKAISKLLNERAKTIAETHEACSRAEAELNMLQIRLGSAEKENAAFKYELNVLNKELEIRNEERVLSRRAADAATKQHLENVKKIAKLEAECQRLRGLVRKKLPGLGALAQMKLEIEGPGKEKGESNKRRSGKGAPPRAAAVDLVQDMIQEEVCSTGKEVDVLLERLTTMEEETNMLKEALAKRNSELQSARLMCARTASKLSSAEEQLDALTRIQGTPKATVITGFEVHGEAAQGLSNGCDQSLFSVCEDNGLNCAESWASALIAELAQFRKGKPCENPEITIDAAKIGQVDDFMAMEQLASLPHSKCGSSICEQKRSREQTDGAAAKASVSNVEDRVSLEESLAKKDGELQKAWELCEEVNTKLAFAEAQLASLQSKNSPNESSLQSLREKLEVIFQAQEEGANVGNILDQIREAMGVPRHSMARLRAQIRRLSKGPHPHDSLSSPSLEGNELTNRPMLISAESSSEEEASSFTESKLCRLGPDLTSAICKVVRLVEDLAVATTVHHLSATSSSKFQHDSAEGAVNPLGGKYTHIAPIVQCKNPELDAKIQKFIAVSNQFLHGKVDVVQFVAELSSVLSHLSSVALSNNSSPPMSRKSLSWDKAFHVNGELEELSGANSPISETSKSDGSEKAAPKVVPADESGTVSRKECSAEELSRIEQLQKVRSEKLALETHMRTEFRRFGDMEQELDQLKIDRVELENHLEAANERLEHLKTQLDEAEQRVANLQVQLASAESSKQLAYEQLSSMAASRAELESQLNASRFELSQLHEKVGALKKEILDGHEKNADLEARCTQFKEQLIRKSDPICPYCVAAAEEAERVNKEREIAAAAEKLAECQRTILDLGKQLKALASPKDSTDASFNESVGPTLSLDEISSERRASFQEEASEAGSSARFLEPEEASVDKKSVRRIKKDLSWDPRDSIASDILDSELASLSRRGHSSGKAMYELFGDKIPAHEDYIEAVAQMPSSPEADPVSPKKSAAKPPHRKKRSPRSFAGIDLSKSMNDAGSPAAEKHGSSFSRFFSRTKSSH